MSKGRSVFIGLVAAALAAAFVPAPAAADGAFPRLASSDHLAARPLHDRLVLRARPGGAPLAMLGRTGAFGGPTVLGVVATRGNWVAVTSEALPNGRVGWVDVRRVRLSVVRWAISIDLSERRLDVLRGGRRIRSMRVAIGSPASPTPSGRYSVAEKMPGTSQGSVYGCCIIALTEHQPNPPAGWSRTVSWYVAIHGGGGIGSAVSAGCFHATDADLRYLMRSIPLGTPVTIRR